MKEIDISDVLGGCILKLHDSVESITDAYFGEEGEVDHRVPRDKYGATEIVSSNGDGSVNRTTVTEYINWIIADGFWGFVRGKKVIHLWVSKARRIEEKNIVGVLAHEIGHIMRPHCKDWVKEQVKAEKYKEVVLGAYGIMEKLREDSHIKLL